jgi:hypothetical protein
MIEIQADFLYTVEFLPDGTATNDQQVWLKAWGEFASNQMLKGKINLWELNEFNPDTGEVPISFIRDIYIKERRPH